MEKINFKNLPDTSTPLNAENLNTMQNNIENAINVIVESGSNRNGNWIKFGDGTMICTMKIDFYCDADFTQDGNLWKKTIGESVFPQEFIDAPYYLNVNIVGKQTARNLWITPYNGYNKSVIGNMQVVTHWNATACHADIFIMAIGRWK